MKFFLLKDFKFKMFGEQTATKGRYQEFTQCDADVIGSDSILLEFEMIQLYSSVFRKLKLNDVVIKINHRQVLNAIEKIGVKDNFNDFVILLDKIDKVVKKLRRNLNLSLIILVVINFRYY